MILGSPPVLVGAGVLLALLGFALAVRFDDGSLGMPGSIMLGIFLLAAWLWSTSVVPPHAVAILVIGLLVGALGVPASLGASWAIPGDEGPIGWERYVAPMASGVMVLILGGLVLSAAAEKHQIDRILAGVMLRPFAGSPGRLVLGVMLTAALLSMWMSNTATAAMVMLLVWPTIQSLPKGSPLRPALTMAVPVGANLGGIATPIGTPPNAIVFGVLNERGEGLTFIDWMMMTLPASLLLLGVGWLALRIAFPWRGLEPPSLPPTRLSEGARSASGPRLVVWITAGITIALWITSTWTRIPVGAIAVIPIAVFPVAGILTADDLRRLPWDVLFMIGGGLALGAGMEATGLAAWLVGVTPLEGLPVWAVIGVVCIVAITLSNFMSNTAVANMLVPIGLGLVAAGQLSGNDSGISSLQMGLAIAISCSAAMALPISTPPNAIAYRTGEVRVAHYLRVGSIVAVAAIAITTAAALLAD